MKTLSGLKMLILSTTLTVIGLSSLHKSIKEKNVNIEAKERKTDKWKSGKVIDISKKPSTTVWIACAIVSLEKKGTGGSDAQEARDRM